MAVVRESFEVFYCYAHEDEHLRNKLEKHLSNLKRQGFIKSWHAGQIVAGTERTDAINNHLNVASIILLLISPDFMDSDDCYAIMKRAMERHDAKETRVIPILLRPTDLKEAPFEKLQLLPANAQPVTTWHNQDEPFADVALGIRKVVEELRQEKTSVGRVFIELLNRMPETTEIRDFLSYHPSVMRLALGIGSKNSKGGWNELLWSVSFDQFNLDCCAQQEWSTVHRIEWHIILLGTLSADLFLSRLKPVQSLADKITLIENLRRYIQSNPWDAHEKLAFIREDFQGVIVTGRRDQLNEATKENLGEYNDILVDIKIRTYDWLVDSAMVSSNDD